MKNNKSSEEELLEFLSSDPDRAFEVLEKMGSDFESIKKLKLGKLFVREYCKFNDNQFEAVDFVFWIAYLIELQVNEMISGAEKARVLGLDNPMIDAMLNKLHFGDKISLIKKHYANKPEDKNFISLLWKINDLRNHVAHGRFEKLKYGGYDLHNPKGQMKLILHLKNELKGKK